MSELSPELQSTIPGWAVNVVKAAGLLLLVWVAAGWAKRTTSRGLERAKFDTTLSNFFSAAIRWAVLLMGVLAAMSSSASRRRASGAVKRPRFARSSSRWTRRRSRGRALRLVIHFVI